MSFLFPLFLVDISDEHYALLPSSLRRILAVAENTLNYLLLNPPYTLCLHSLPSQHLSYSNQVY